MIEIMIVDDHPVVRRGLREILNGERDIRVTAEADTAEEALSLARDRHFDAVVLDLILPNRSGFDLLQDLHHEYPEIPVLIMSVHPEEQFAARVLKAGASGYLMKDSAPEELVRAVRKIHAGGHYISLSFAEKLARDLGEGIDHPPHEKLSHREFQILQMIARGRTIKGIAETLYISEKTVSTYRHRILQKLNFQTNAEIITYALREGLLQ